MIDVKKKWLRDIITATLGSIPSAKGAAKRSENRMHWVRSM